MKKLVTYRYDMDGTKREHTYALVGEHGATEFHFNIYSDKAPPLQGDVPLQGSRSLGCAGIEVHSNRPRWENHIRDPRPCMYCKGGVCYPDGTSLWAVRFLEIVGYYLVDGTDEQRRRAEDSIWRELAEWYDKIDRDEIEAAL